MNFKTISVASVMAVALTTAAASAATLSLAGSGYLQQTLVGTYSLGSGGGVSIDYLTGDIKDGTNGLSLDGPAMVSYTYIGSEAGNRNYSMDAGGAQFNNDTSSVNDGSGPFSAVAGLLKFLFGTSSPAGSVGVINNDGVAVQPSINYAIGYDVASDGQSAFLYFDDIAGGDRDFDDLVVKVSISAVPVPAAGFLLLAGLGGLAALKRRRARS